MTSSRESMKHDEFERGRYPGELETDIEVGSGATLRMRPIGGEDAKRLEEFHARLSFDSIYRGISTSIRSSPPMRCGASRRSIT